MEKKTKNENESEFLFLSKNLFAGLKFKLPVKLGASEVGFCRISFHSNSISGIRDTF